MLKKMMFIVGLLVLVLAIGSVLSPKVLQQNSKQNSIKNLNQTANTNSALDNDKAVVKVEKTDSPATTKPVVSTNQSKEDTQSSEILEDATKQVTNEASTETSNDNKKYLIVIDPGHQSHGNYSEEAIAPGSRETKPKVSSGTQGRYTKVPEYQVNLDVSLKLAEALKQKGYDIMMTRTTNDVDISNQERAEIANDNDADVFIRIHCNGSEDSKVNGILTISPTKDSKYCKSIYEKSRKLSDSVLDAMVQATGAKNCGVTETDTMSGINWSLVPVTIVEMGYMSNKAEDNRLVSEIYQKKLVDGLVKGIESYLNSLE